MSISGNLEDVSVADVLQFVHLGHSTGTLTLQRREHRAEITFHRGRIINALSADSKRLGELLVARRLISQDDLDQALRIQESAWPRQSLGQVLTATQLISIEQIHRVVTRQIERTIFRVMMWKEGEFEFIRDQLKPIDELGMYPGDVLANIRLNTEQLLLRGAQMYDEGDSLDSIGGGMTGIPENGVAAMREKSKRGENLETGATFTLGDVAEFSDAVLSEDPGEDSRPSLPAPGKTVRPRLQVLTQDGQFVEQLRGFLPNENGHLGQVELRDAGSALPGEPAPVVLVDLRNNDFDLGTVESIRRLRPRATVVAMVDEVLETTRSYEAGAVAAVPGNPQAVASCLASLVRDRGFSDYRIEVEKEAKAGFNKLRRIVADLRSGVISATMALNLMHILSESVERAVLFLVRPDTLASLGAFGFGADRKPLAQLCGGMRLRMADNCALIEVIDSGSARSSSFAEANLPEELAQKIGRPSFDQVAAIPVVGTERVIAVIYADNGDAYRPMEEIEMLELAAAQVGVAFENELLRRQLSGKSTL